MPPAIRELRSVEEHNYGFNLEQCQENINFCSRMADFAALQVAHPCEVWTHNEEERNCAALVTFCWSCSFAPASVRHWNYALVGSDVQFIICLEYFFTLNSCLDIGLDL